MRGPTFFSEQGPAQIKWPSLHITSVSVKPATHDPSLTSDNDGSCVAGFTERWHSWLRPVGVHAGLWELKNYVNEVGRAILYWVCRLRMLIDLINIHYVLLQIGLGKVLVYSPKSARS